MNRSVKYLITIVGPTAVGKTTLSIEIAQKLNCEIISCDSGLTYPNKRQHTYAN